MLAHERRQTGDRPRSGRTRPAPSASTRETLAFSLTLHKRDAVADSTQRHTRVRAPTYTYYTSMMSGPRRGGAHTPTPPSMTYGIARQGCSEPTTHAWDPKARAPCRSGATDVYARQTRMRAPCRYLERLVSMRSYASQSAPASPLLLIVSHPPEYGTHMPNELQASGCASKPHCLSTGVRSAASGLRLL